MRTRDSSPSAQNDRDNNQTIISFYNYSYVELTLNKDAHQLFTFPQITFVDKDNKPVFLPEDKVVVLDFWTTSCGVCFKKFPAFEESFLKYKSNQQVVFYSVNVPVKRDTLETTKKLVSGLGYQFPTIYTKEYDSIIRGKKLKFKGYPQLFILKNNQVLYNGSLVVEKWVVINSLDSEIKRALNY